MPPKGIDALEAEMHVLSERQASIKEDLGEIRKALDSFIGRAEQKLERVPELANKISSVAKDIRGPEGSEPLPTRVAIIERRLDTLDAQQEKSRLAKESFRVMAWGAVLSAVFALLVAIVAPLAVYLVLKK